MERKFNLRSTERGFFRMYVEIMSIQKPLNRLRKQEREVLSEIMYQNSIIARDYKDPEDPKKWRELFSYERKQEMGEKVGDMSEASFANCLTSLRKHGLINQDNYLHDRLRIYPSERSSIAFNFHVMDIENA